MPHLMQNLQVKIKSLGYIIETVDLMLKIFRSNQNTIV
ncbi:hypothetical protein BBG19_0324 [Francisella sp. MA067296]|nr:hypothetical protein BBG19_0324 [Francisella sp. MA067296]